MSSPKYIVNVEVSQKIKIVVAVNVEVVIVEVLVVKVEVVESGVTKTVAVVKVAIVVVEVATYPFGRRKSPPRCGRCGYGRSLTGKKRFTL